MVSSLGLTLWLLLIVFTLSTTSIFEAPRVNFQTAFTLALLCFFFTTLLRAEATHVYLVDSSNSKTQYISIGQNDK